MMGVKISDDFTGSEKPPWKGSYKAPPPPTPDDTPLEQYGDPYRGGVPKMPGDIACSFCGKSRAKAKQLLASTLPSTRQSYICDACVTRCSDTLGANAANGSRELKVISAADIGMEATNWLWEDEHGQWIPEGALSLMAGREGVGKSTVVTDMVAKLTLGTLPGENFGTPRSVIICATEDSWKQTINPRLAAAGADLTRVKRVDAYTPEGFEGTLQLPEDIEQVRAITVEYDVVLIVLDPLMSALSAKLDSHKDAEVRRALEPLSRLAHTANLAVVGLIHENKSSASDLLSRIMGSRAFTAVVRAVLYAARKDADEEDSRDEDEFSEPFGMPVDRKPAEFILGQSKSNLGRLIQISLRYQIEGVRVGWDEVKNKAITSSRIVWGEVETQSVQDIVKAQESVKRDVKVSEAKKFLKDYLAGKGEVPSHTVMTAGEALGHTKSTIQRARGALRVSVKPLGKNQTTWSLLPS
jgi:RecA-family ATPase